MNSPAKEGRLPSLDGLGALAVMLVLLGHCAKFGLGMGPELRRFSSYIPGGRWGVGLFFYISGFLITYLLLQEERVYGKVDLRSFYVRRVLRILPVYWTFLAVTFVLEWNFGTPYRLDYLAALTFTTGVWENFGWFLGHLWSLAVEDQFYLL